MESVPPDKAQGKGSPLACIHARTIRNERGKVNKKISGVTGRRNPEMPDADNGRGTSWFISAGTLGKNPPSGWNMKNRNGLKEEVPEISANYGSGRHRRLP